MYINVYINLKKEKKTEVWKIIKVYSNSSDNWFAIYKIILYLK